MAKDNGIMEQFFGKMKNEMFYGHESEFKTLDELYKAMNYIKRWLIILITTITNELQ